MKERLGRACPVGLPHMGAVDALIRLSEVVVDVLAGEPVARFDQVDQRGVAGQEFDAVASLRDRIVEDLELETPKILLLVNWSSSAEIRAYGSPSSGRRSP